MWNNTVHHRLHFTTINVNTNSILTVCVQFQHNGGIVWCQCGHCCDDACGGGGGGHDGGDDGYPHEGAFDVHYHYKNYRWPTQYKIHFSLIICDEQRYMYIQ